MLVVCVCVWISVVISDVTWTRRHKFKIAFIHVRSLAPQLSTVSAIGLACVRVCESLGVGESLGVCGVCIIWLFPQVP